MSGIDLPRVRAELAVLADAMRSARSAPSPAVSVHRQHADAAANLLDYLVLRREDRRALQQDLRALGLSTLGRCEACVFPTVDAVLTNLDALLGCPPTSPPARHAFDAADAELEHHTTALLGPPVPGRAARVMVTLPSEAAERPSLAAELIEAGMGIARINAAHDTPEAWEAMARSVRTAAGSRPCPIFVDLPGPKLRTLLPEGAHHPPRVNPGDTLRLLGPGRPAPGGPAISCADAAVLARLRPGQRVWFDDGKIGTRVEHAEPHAVTLRVESTLKPDAPIKPDRGINIPDTDLTWEAWTDADDAALAFAAAHADMAGLSFVSRPEEIDRVRALADAHRAPGHAAPGLGSLGMVLKVETRRAFDSLPALLLALMRTPRCGVMIARGDLAVEVGPERLAEVQEEILWLCEAARIPVIWATQVLETLAKKGRATRAEITDAAMSVRAECVMLNKGPSIATAARTLDDILRRMQPHQTKKRAMLRRLEVAARWLDEPHARPDPANPPKPPTGLEPAT